MTKYYMFVKFLFNGSIIDQVSWLIQMVFYCMAVLFLPSLNYKIAISICLSFIITLFINFFTLKKNVFKSGGLFYRFVIITASVIVVVGLLSEIMSNNLSSILVKTLGFTFLNPHVYSDTVFFLGNFSKSFSQMDKYYFGAGAAISSFLFFFTIGYLSKYFSKYLKSVKVWKRINYLIILFMSVLALTVLMEII